MALDFGKRDVGKLAGMLDPEYGSEVKELRRLKKELKASEDDEERAGLERLIAAKLETLDQIETFAAAALDEAMQIIESKAKYTVVGQIKTKRGEEPGDKVALGWYATEKQALDDAVKLTYSTQTHEQALAWTLPVHHGTPHEWYGERKRALRAEAMGDSSPFEEELQRRIQWCADHPGEQPPKEWGIIPLNPKLEDCPMCDGAGHIIINEEEAP